MKKIILIGMICFILGMINEHIFNWIRLRNTPSQFAYEIPNRKIIDPDGIERIGDWQYVFLWQDEDSYYNTGQINFKNYKFELIDIQECINDNETP